MKDTYKIYGYENADKWLDTLKKTTEQIQQKKLTEEQFLEKCLEAGIPISNQKRFLKIYYKQKRAEAKQKWKKLKNKNIKKYSKT